MRLKLQGGHAAQKALDRCLAEYNDELETLRERGRVGAVLVSRCVFRCPVSRIR